MPAKDALSRSWSLTWRYARRMKKKIYGKRKLRLICPATAAFTLLMDSARLAEEPTTVKRTFAGLINIFINMSVCFILRKPSCALPTSSPLGNEHGASAAPAGRISHYMSCCKEISTHRLRTQPAESAYDMLNLHTIDLCMPASARFCHKKYLSPY